MENTNDEQTKNIFNYPINITEENILLDRIIYNPFSKKQIVDCNYHCGDCILLKFDNSADCVKNLLYLQKKKKIELFKKSVQQKIEA